MSDNQTPELTPPVGCSTERPGKRTIPDDDTTPTASPHKVPTTTDKGIVELSIGRGEGIENHEGEHKVRKSDMLKTAKRVEKLGGLNIFNLMKYLEPKPRAEKKKVIHFTRGPNPPTKVEKSPVKSPAETRSGSLNPQRGECRGEVRFCRDLLTVIPVKQLEPSLYDANISVEFML